MRKRISIFAAVIMAAVLAAGCTAPALEQPAQPQDQLGAAAPVAEEAKAAEEAEAEAPEAEAAETAEEAQTAEESVESAPEALTEKTAVPPRGTEAAAGWVMITGLEAASTVSTALSVYTVPCALDTAQRKAYPLYFPSAVKESVFVVLPAQTLPLVRLLKVDPLALYCHR